MFYLKTTNVLVSWPYIYYKGCAGGRRCAICICTYLLWTCACITIMYSIQSNTFQGILITDGSSSYAVFIYNCSNMEWGGSVINWYQSETHYAVYYASGLSNSNRAVCGYQTTIFTTLVYRIDKSKFHQFLLSPTLIVCLYHSLCISLLCNLHLNSYSYSVHVSSSSACRYKIVLESTCMLRVSTSLPHTRWYSLYQYRMSLPLVT